MFQWMSKILKWRGGVMRNKIYKLNIIAQSVIIQIMKNNSWALFPEHNPDSASHKNSHGKKYQHWNDYLPLLHASNIYRHNQNCFFGLPTLAAPTLHR